MFALRYSLSAHPAPDPVASRTSSVGFVPLLQLVVAPEAEHEVNAVADPLPHWS